MPKPARSPKPSKPSKRTKRPSSRKRWWILGGIAAFLIVLYLIAPLVILQVLNRNLNKNPKFDNHVGGLVLNPFQGGYTLKDFAIRRKLGDTLIPVFTARSIDVSLQWSSLPKGSPRAKALVEEPRLNLVAQFFEPKRKKKPGAWQRTFDLFHVFPVDEIAVRDGEIHFLDFSKKPIVDVHLDALEGAVTGLTVARGRDSSSRLPSALEARAKFMNQAPVRVKARMLAGAAQPTLDLRAELQGFRLAQLNGAFRAYTRLDVEGGVISVATRLRASEGRFEGVVHREAEGMKVFDPEKDNEGFLTSTWEAVTDAAAKLVEKRAEPDADPDIPVSGSFEPESETWSAIGGLLKGTFTRALDPRLGKSMGKDVGIRWDTPEVSKARKILSF